MRKKQSKIASSNKSSRNLSLGAGNLSDNKLNHMALHLEYLFQWDINFRERIITIEEPIVDGVFSKVDAALTEMESQSKKSVTVRIFSEGGSVYCALAIAARLRKSKCRIITEAYGCCMSAATLILACGDLRRMSDMSWLMHHGSSYELEYDKHEIQKNKLKQIEREEKQWAQWMAHFTKKNESFWYKEGSIIDKYMTPEDCLNAGVIDEYV